MFPFQVDPRWYEKHWLTEAPQPNKRFPTRRAAGLVLALALLAGGGVALSHFHSGHIVSDYQGWEQE